MISYSLVALQATFSFRATFFTVFFGSGMNVKISLDREFQALQESIKLSAREKKIQKIHTIFSPEKCRKF